MIWFTSSFALRASADESCLVMSLLSELETASPLAGLTGESRVAEPMPLEAKINSVSPFDRLKP
jgi:hypothetical protein